MGDPDETTSAFYFNPAGEGVAIFLGPTESRIMEILWQEGSASVKGIERSLSTLSPISDSAIQTILDRLGKRGMVRREKEGRNFRYHPAISRDVFLKDRIRIVESALKRNLPTQKKRD